MIRSSYIYIHSIHRDTQPLGSQSWLLKEFFRVDFSLHRPHDHPFAFSGVSILLSTTPMDRGTAAEWGNLPCNAPCGQTSSDVQVKWNKPQSKGHCASLSGGGGKSHIECVTTSQTSLFCPERRRPKPGSAKAEKGGSTVAQVLYFQGTLQAV